MRIRFDAKLKTFSEKGDFPADTITTVFVTNRDGCSYSCVPVNNHGELSVDYDMKPLKDNVRLTERIKFHYFFKDNKDGLLKPVCAGHMKLVDLANRVADAEPFKVCSNFSTNTVLMEFRGNNEHSVAMHKELLELYQKNLLAPSVLDESPTHFSVIKQLDEHIKNGLDKNTVVSKENGGTMFQSIFSAHMMEDEATLYCLYHLDFDQPENVPAFQCGYMLAETLNHNARTIEEVLQMDLKGKTEFVASYAQAPMRSASVVPYNLDLSLSDDPRSHTRTMLSEVFKRPYSLPNQLSEDGRAALLRDDCEGLATLMHNATRHLAYLYENHYSDFKDANYVAYNTLVKRYFPRELCGSMSPQYQNKLMGLAMHLGELVSKNIIECKITLVTANAPSMGGEGGPPTMELQAHACASMVCNDPNMPHAVMMEGTACVADDQSSKRFKLGSRYVTLSDVANSLTMAPPFNTFMESGLKTKMAMHLTHSRGSFYDTAFCQNDALIGSQIGSQPLTFGVGVEYLADDSIKVYMPVTGMQLQAGELDRLKEYIIARRSEIHLPLVDHDELRACLKWAPMVPYKGCKELAPGREFTTCLVHVAADANNPLDQLLKRAQAEAETFNANPENAKVGVMRAFASMDGVSKVFHIYSDDTTELAKKLSFAS